MQTAAGRAADAERCYQRAIQLQPDYANPYYNLGDLLLREDRPSEAVSVFDACLARRGRDYHALAYKAHALFDADLATKANWLLNFETYVKTYVFKPPSGYADISGFNAALASHVRQHPSLQSNVMSTVHGQHTGELLRAPAGPMAVMEERIQDAIRWYVGCLPEDAQHPMVRFAPRHWQLTTWGVVLHDRGHERPHIHPNG